MTECKASTAILAGNSRVHLGSDKAIQVEAQIHAFEAAMRFATNFRERTGCLPKISLAFDHQGIFRVQFLRENLTNSQKRNPRLAHLRDEIVHVYAHVAAKYDVPIDAIRVIHEDSARQHASHILATQDVPEAVRNRMVSRQRGGSTAPSSNPVDHPTEKLTCAVITKEYFDKAASTEDGAQATLEVFFEDSPWSRDLAYVKGMQLSHLLGVSTSIRLNMVHEDGKVVQGQLIEASSGQQDRGIDMPSARHHGGHI